MVTLLLDSTQLDVVLSLTERALAFRKGDLTVERAHIRKVQLTDDPWTWLRGIPSPGTHVRGVVAMGTWKSAGGSDFVIVRRRKPGVVIDLDGDAEIQRIVLTTRHGLALAQALRLEGEGEPVDVAEITAPTPTASPRPKRARAPKTAPATA